MTTFVIDSAPTGTASATESAAKPRKDPGTHTKNTLFLKGLPATCTPGDLETFFSEWGPVRSAFPVTKQESSSAKASASAIGFVHFALAEDAQRALAALQKGDLQFMGRPLTGEPALRKRKENKVAGEGGKRVRVKKTEATGSTGTDKTEATASPAPVKRPAKARAGPEPKKSRSTNDSPVLTISIVPHEQTAATALQFDKKQLYKRLRKCGDLTKVIFPYEDSFARARLLFSSPAAARGAAPKIDQRTFKGHCLRVETPETTNSAASSTAKAHRLIIRNLPWRTSEEALRQALAPLGTLLDVTLPKGAQGASRGFAFIQFAERVQAEAAMARFNGQMLLGRPVALDFALSKSHYLRAEHEETGQGGGGATSKIEKGAADADTSDAEVDVEGTSDADEERDEDVDIEHVSDDEEHRPSPADKGDAPRTVTDTGDEKDAPLPDSSPLSTTVFIRNVPFTTEEGELTSLLAERFGPVAYCKLVRDPQTGATRGTAFAKFTTVQAAQEAISESAKLTQDQLDARHEGSPAGAKEPSQSSRLDDKLAALARKRTGKTFKSVISGDALPPSASSDPSGLVLEGRALSIVPAVDRGRAKELRSHPFLDAGPQDRRHLHLLGETLLKTKTSAAKRFWPPIDISYREQAVRERRKELKANPNLLVSRARLSLRHLPLAADEKIVRKVLYTAVHRARAHPEGPVIDPAIFPAGGKPHLRQVKVIRDPQRNRSKGYAFAEFTEAGDALAAVRYLANWEPGLWRELGGEAFSAAARHKSEGPFRAKAPLVEFATEKRAVLEKRQARMDGAAKNK